MPATQAKVKIVSGDTMLAKLPRPNSSTIGSQPRVAMPSRRQAPWTRSARMPSAPTRLTMTMARTGSSASVTDLRTRM